MAEEKKKDAGVGAGGETPSPRPQKGKKMLLLMAIFLVVLGAGAVLFLIPNLLPFGERRGNETTQERGQGAKLQGHLYSLESMIVNLADPDFPRYLKIKIDLESVSPKPQEEFDKRLPQLKDLLLTILTSKTYAEISDSTGKTRLKEEILEKANQLYQGLKIKTVYFTEFVVQ